MPKSGYFRRFGHVEFEKEGYVGMPETWEEIRLQELARWRLLDAQFRSYDVPDHMYHEVDDDYMYTITLV